MTIAIDWSQLISSILGASIGGGFAILGARLSINASIKHLREEFQHEREKAKVNGFIALKVEVRENLKTLKEKSDYITLSNERKTAEGLLDKAKNILDNYIKTNEKLNKTQT